MPYSIYALTDPRDNQVRYIGMSINPEQRYKEHLSLNEYTPAKEDWLIDLLSLGMKPIMTIIDHADSKPDALVLEAYWMLHYHLAGSSLLNGEIVHATSDYDKVRMVARLTARSSSTTARQVVNLDDLHKLHQENEQLRNENIRLRGLLGDYRTLLDPLLFALHSGKADEMQKQASDILDIKQA
jgi:hypothetical protein